VDYPGLKSKVRELAKVWRPNRVLVEDAGTGTSLIAELRSCIPGLVGIIPKKDKQARMSSTSAKFEAGQVLLPERATWLPDLEAELFSFPGARYDDQCDSISQALEEHAYPFWMRKEVLEALIRESIRRGPWGNRYGLHQRDRYY